MAFNNALNNSKRIKEQKKVFRIGDVLWAKISGYPTWPCIVCPDPYTKDFIKEKKNNNVSLHVRFLNDQGKRSWVKNTVLFQGKKALFSAYPKYKFNFQKKKKLFMMWKLAITEAKELLKFNEERRLKQFYTKYSIPDDSESNTSMSHSRKQPIPDQASFSSKRFKKTENKSLDGCVNNTPMTSTSTDPLLYSEIEHESREKSQPTSDRNSENIQQPNAQSSKKVKREKSQQTSDRNSEIIQQPIAESSKKVKREKSQPTSDRNSENIQQPYAQSSKKVKREKSQPTSDRNSENIQQPNAQSSKKVKREKSQPTSDRNSENIQQPNAQSSKKVKREKSQPTSDRNSENIQQPNAQSSKKVKREKSQPTSDRNSENIQQPNAQSSKKVKREKSQPTSDRNSENIQQPNAQSSKKVKREKSQQTSDRNSEIIQQPIAESSKKVKREKSQPTSDRNSENIQQPNAQSSKKVKREKSQQTSDRNSEIIQQPIAKSSKKVKRKKLPPCPDNYEENDTEEDRQSDLTRKTQILKKTKSFLSRCKSFRKSLLKEAQYHACVVCTDANNTVKCEGSCNLHFHRHCFAINRQKIKSTTKFKKGSGKRNKRRSSTVKQNMDNLNENLVHEQLVQNDFNNKCSQCTDGKSVCFVCESPIDKKEELVSCKFKNCSNFFHTNCLEEWPQSLWIQDNRVMCPHHNCHFCISDNPLKGRKTHVLTGKLLKCIKCPTSYHRSEYCLTAGSKVLSYFDIICNKHIDTKNTIRHYNTRWCLICAKSGGPLVRCELCPNSFHFECSNDDPSQFENGGFICDECKSGRFPVYGEIVWTKLGTYRWWPAQIMFPEEVPDTVNAKEHSVGEFVVQFFGTLDYCWMNRGQVYLFDEGDQAPTVKNKKKDIDQLFHDAVIEAIEAHKIYISNKNKRDALIANKSSLKPIHYVKIKFNCPFGKLKYKNLKTCKKDAICKCDPNEEDPCSLDSSCINRQMLFECDPKTCPAGQKCKNQDFEKQLGPQLATFLTENKGWGVKTLENIKHGSFIIEYVGDLLNNEEFKKRMNEMQRNHEQNFYFLSLDNSVIIDAGPKGNLSRFMNHSCDPNCEAVKWVVDGESRIGLFALRDIAAGTELVFNYQSRKAKCRDVNKKPCHCGAKNCCEFLEF